jgi:outer membrane protein OmpA-like peptidoglycan-associated protein
MTKGKILAVGALEFAFLIAVAVWSGARLEDRLASDGQQALDAAGEAVVYLEADGRRLLITPLAGDNGQNAAELLRDVDGVRAVEIRDPESDVAVAVAASATTEDANVADTAPDETAAREEDPEQGSDEGSQDSTPEEAEPDAESLEVARTIAGLLLAAPLESDADSDDPTDSTKETLDEVAELLVDNELRLSVVGLYGDEEDEDDNLIRSLDRAWAVAGYLEFRRIDFDRMDVSGIGSGDGDLTGQRVDLMVLQGDPS